MQRDRNGVRRRLGAAAFAIGMMGVGGAFAQSVPDYEVLATFCNVAMPAAGAGSVSHHASNGLDVKRAGAVVRRLLPASADLRRRHLRHTTADGRLFRHADCFQADGDDLHVARSLAFAMCARQIPIRGHPMASDGPLLSPRLF